MFKEEKNYFFFNPLFLFPENEEPQNKKNLLIFCLSKIEIFLQHPKFPVLRNKLWQDFVIILHCLFCYSVQEKLKHFPFLAS